ncbi:MAG: hypothetical protein OMOMHJEC_00203 [Xanthomonadales bacterium]|nr:hypothetical protein [Xanthomonadales bacterium]
MALADGFGGLALPVRAFARAALAALPARELARRLHRQHAQLAARAHRQFHRFQQACDLLGLEFAVPATFQILAEFDDAVAHAFQSADLGADRFPQSPHLALAAFADEDLEPLVAAFAAERLDLLEVRWAIFQFDARPQSLQGLVGDLAVHAHQVLAFDLARRMHQPVREFAVGGEQQQAGGVEVKPADHDPARPLEPRQAVEHGRATFGIDGRGDLALGLVVTEHPRPLVSDRAHHELAPVQAHRLAVAQGRADGRRTTVDLDLATQHALLDHSPRAEPGLGEQLLQAFGSDLAGAALQRQGGAAFHWRVSVEGASGGEVETAASRRVKSSSGSIASRSRISARVGSSSRLFRPK